MALKIAGKIDSGEKQFCLYLADEKGFVYAVDINMLLQSEKSILKAKNAMKK